MPRPYVDRDRIHIGKNFSIAFQRTLRVPDDGRDYPLPPALGKFPVRSADAFASRVPADWLGTNHFLLPMHRMEAAWLAFRGVWSEPKAVKVGVGNINAVSGQPWDETLRADPQDYLVSPYQRWLDGIKAGDGKVRQFVAVPLGQGLTIEAQIHHSEHAGGIQILVVEPAARLTTPEPAPQTKSSQSRTAPAELGMGAGGWIKQRIYPDPFGLQAWNQDNRSSFWVHLLDSEAYSRLTGEQAPAPVIDAATYARFGLPWFEVYDQERGDLAPSTTLSQVKSLGELTDMGQTPVEDLQVRPIPPRGKRTRGSEPRA
jgi:hypothetical protein